MKFNFIEFLKLEKEKDYFKKIVGFINNNQSQKIFPPKKQIFSAFENFDYDNLKVIIIGQDPYPTVNVANGLAFSINKSNPYLPMSLQNMFKELKKDYPNVVLKNGDLTSWKNQGVMLINTILTVFEGRPLSHKNIGWEEFVINFLKEINEIQDNIIYIALGGYARNFLSKLNLNNQILISTSHPSPLGYNKGFENFHLFKRINQKLKDLGKSEIDWSIY
ncbi:uracil-DNA glycosylase [Metamycoplasma hyosynoviae]|uniref:Uracil-DNA glycosylase n=1 Tax=Metamycoplasma hyosynoviae TaxID=29559 RepID=A0A063YAZ1_9BACT|nr:uracil-DNA glycosylase [Metamycoplasma hyosynoviae]ASI53713.1 uracil-DNA glycosylase [Metamycoplasma hyosynoviae]KDE41850.1 uracil-DNA glycosylase [Metamycoplasma hyosynoviae]KDE42325.1 uracil-DNA glycosylase [Metamycoplasma hyosynoviae]KDE42877.1 uracil-DNA glycosylase [Metamycoplasma hyosynoviae]KDE44218.1 uracil-DNA glycosylase [Metamycoplasma hyosynoviae]